MGDDERLDPRLREFVRLFNAGRYWDAHEALEDAWRETDSAFYQGLILYASAFVHAQRNNAHGVTAQLRKAQPKLHPRRPHYLGLDVDAILGHAGDAIAIVQREREGDWADRVLPARLEIRDDLVRGDEKELRGAGGP